MRVLNYGFPTNSISVVETLASTALAVSFLAMSLFGIVGLGGIFYSGRTFLV